MDPVVCSSCGARFPVKSLTENEYSVLTDQYYYQNFAEELRMLLKVQKFYRRHPEAEGRIKPHFDRVLESDDPQVRESQYAGVPYDQIELPPEQLPEGWLDKAEDAEVVEYLRSHGFELGPRMEFVSQKVDSLLKGSVGAVRCARCQVGRLHVPPDEWDEFNARDATTWYRPLWHDLDSDGTLHVRASGWQGRTHWTGEMIITPEKPEYDFWRWLVSQKEYHRLVKESELPGIKEEWLRRTSRGA